MARKIIDVTINDRGEDKTFRITELSASAAEAWASQLFFAMANSGIEIPEDLEEMGFAGIMQMGIGALGKLKYEEVKPLLDKMMECVQFYPDPFNKLVVRMLLEEDIEDVQTRLKLRKEIIKLHVDFSKAAKP
jgi:hypothetical protein